MSKEQENCFVNEIVMNEYTLREILLAMWRRKAARRRFPIVIYLIVTVVPMVYAFVTGKNEFMLLAGVIGLAGLLLLLIYAGVFAVSATKKREALIRQTMEKYGNEAMLTIWIGDEIHYCFDHMEKTVAYSEIEAVIEIEMYLILQLKNGVELPIWKAGFKQGKWDDFVPYLKQRLGKN